MKKIVISSNVKNISISRKRGYEAGLDMLKKHPKLMENLRNK